MGVCIPSDVLGLNQIVFAGLASVFVFISGGIHLDGFCDAADAIGSRQARKNNCALERSPRWTFRHYDAGFCSSSMCLYTHFMAVLIGLYGQVCCLIDV